MYCKREEINKMKEAAAQKATQNKVWSKVKFIGGATFFIAAGVFLCVLLGPQKITTEQLALGFAVLFAAMIIGLFYFLRG